MVKLIGALAVITAGAGWGFTGVRRLNLRAENTRRMVEALMTMRREICSSLCPMEDVLKTLKMQTRGAVGQFFDKLCRDTSRLGKSTFSQIWSDALDGVNMGFTRTEVLTLKQLGESLGRYPAPEQEQALSYAIARFEIYAKNADEERRNKSKLSAVMGIAAGVFTVIILL